MIPNIVTGTLTATGAAMNVVLGFKPKHVLIINETTQITLEWTDTMVAGKGLKTVQAGTNSFVASGGISQYAGVAAPAALSGTVAVSVGSAVVTGSSSKFLSEVKVGDTIAIPGIGIAGIGGVASPDTAYGKVVTITSDTSLTCQVNFDYAGSGKAAFNTSGIGEGFSLGTDSINTSTNVLHYVASRSN